MDFEKLGLRPSICGALKAQGYQTPTPIQEGAIPPALAGRDVLGIAQTGTGKTCAFAAPILQRLAQEPAGKPKAIRALILTPTRELALQIQEAFEAYGKNIPLKSTVIFGGVGQQPQVEKLQRGVDILVATPGRLLDLSGQGLLDLEHVSIFVLDEADRMLDMGFIHDVRRVLKLLPQKKQTLFFSATMPPEVQGLVNELLHDPAKVAVTPVSSPVEAIRQTLYFVDKGNKGKLLAYLVSQPGVKNALVFSRTKHGANKIAQELTKAGISAAAIHGNKSQTARQQALSDFKAGRVKVLAATDIAARGLDIEELSHVFNYNLPDVPETYVHRIGRTGRAGRGGVAVSFCDFGEKDELKAIEKLLGKSIPVVEDHPWPMTDFTPPQRDKRGKIVNPEDAEARQAAREKKKTRDEDTRDEDFRRWMEEERRIQARKGYISGPLAGEEVMDATARLLAPKRESRRAVGDGAERGGKPRRSETAGLSPRRSEAAARSASNPSVTPPQRGRKAAAKLDRPEKTEKKPPEKAGTRQAARKSAGRGPRNVSKGGSASPSDAEIQRPSRRAGSTGKGKPRRSARAERPRASGQMDSTEHHSLMKPYYLNDD